MNHLAIITPDAQTWNAFVANHTAGSILQTTPWGALKTRFGWQAAQIGITSEARLVAGAQVLFRRLPLGWQVAYAPHGPLVDWTNSSHVQALLAALDALCRQQGAILLKIEPLLPPPAELVAWQPSPHTIQPPRTIWIDLTGTEDELLARMHAKTRYNIKLATRKGVTIRTGTENDLAAFYALLQATGTRDGFGVHNLDYYRAAFELFVPQHARLFVAEAAGEPIAGLFAFICGPMAYYFYGASGNTHREKMPNYALQWETMRWARAQGCTMYDLWGIPDQDEAKLEAHYLERNDGLWGVYRFKRGFGGRIVRYAGAFDRIYHPLGYMLYRLALKMRRTGLG